MLSGKMLQKHISCSKYEGAVAPRCAIFFAVFVLLSLLGASMAFAEGPCPTLEGADGRKIRDQTICLPQNQERCFASYSQYANDCKALADICASEESHPNCQKLAERCTAPNAPTGGICTEFLLFSRTYNTAVWKKVQQVCSDPQKAPKTSYCDQFIKRDESQQKIDGTNKYLPDKSFVFVGLDFDGLNACLACSLVELLANTAYELGGKAHQFLKTSVTALLAAIFGIYLLLQAGKLLLPFGPLENAAGVFNAVMTRSLVVMLAMTFMLGFGNYWTLIHTPPLTSAINLTSALMDKTKQTLGGSALIEQSCGLVNSSDITAISKAMSCTMRNAQDTVGKGLLSGLGVMFTNSLSGNPLAQVTSGAVAILIAIASSAVLLLIYAPLYLSLPLKMADIIVRWTLLAVLSPLVIGAAAFPVTRSLMFAALKGIIQAALELLMYGVVVAFGAYAMNTSIQSLTTNDAVYAPALNSALFWQLLLIGLITNTLLRQSRSVAIALTDPSPNPAGMNAGAVDELGQQAAQKINATAAKGLNEARGMWQSRMS